MYAKHSIHYTHMPSYFIAFDIYDKAAQKFLSRIRRDEILADSGIPIVPFVARGIFSREKLIEMLDTPSQYYSGPVEGIFARFDGEEYNREKAKIVRPDFLHGIEVHFSKLDLVKNIVRYE